jgi:hypothetical protein
MNGITTTASVAKATAAHGGPEVRDLLRRMVDAGESFWSTGTRAAATCGATVKAILKKGSARTGGSYRLVVRLFQHAGRRPAFLGFLRTYGCHLTARFVSRPDRASMRWVR